LARYIKSFTCCHSEYYFSTNMYVMIIGIYIY
jgi:hypothetical protein